MVKETFKRLKKKKKWKKKEVEEAIRFLEKRKKKKTIFFLDKAAYWVALFIAIIGNMMIAASLVPFLLTLNQAMLYVVVVVIGLSFGFFFEIVVRDLEHIERRHHIIISILIPAVAVISFFVITVIANSIKKIFGITTAIFNPFLVALAYTLAFILPYTAYQAIIKNR